MFDEKCNLPIVLLLVQQVDKEIFHFFCCPVIQNIILHTLTY